MTLRHFILSVKYGLRSDNLWLHQLGQGRQETGQLGGLKVNLNIAENIQTLKSTLKTDSFLTVGDRVITTKKNIARTWVKDVDYLGSYQLDVKAMKMVKTIPEEEFKLLEFKSKTVRKNITVT